MVILKLFKSIQNLTWSLKYSKPQKMYQIVKFQLIKDSCSELNLASTPQPKLTNQIDLIIQKSSKSENKIMSAI